METQRDRVKRIAYPDKKTGLWMVDNGRASRMCCPVVGVAGVVGVMHRWGCCFFEKVGKVTLVYT